MDIKSMTDEQLRSEFQAFYGAIYILECYGTRDMQEMMGVSDELVSRGYTIEPGAVRPVISKEPYEEI